MKHSPGSLYTHQPRSFLKSEKLFSSYNQSGGVTSYSGWAIYHLVSAIH